MKIIGRGILNNFKSKQTDVRSQIDSWEAEVTIAIWQKPLDLKRRYASASILPNNEVIFNLKGNKYRLLVQVNYKNQIVLVKKVGNHKEYMKW